MKSTDYDGKSWMLKFESTQPCSDATKRLAFRALFLADDFYMKNLCEKQQLSKIR